MKPGGIRRLIVPVELGYPDNDFNKKGPKPSTFSVRLNLAHYSNGDSTFLYNLGSSDLATELHSYETRSEFVSSLM